MSAATAPLRAAVIGCGPWGRVHMRAYVNSPDTRLVAVAARSPERTARVAAHFGVTPYTSVAELIEKERPDLISVSTSDQGHFEPTRLALEAGIPVLVEKPLTVDLDEARQLVDLSQRTGGRCGVNFGMRYLMPFQLMRTAIDEGRIGPIISALWKFTHWWPPLVGGAPFGMMLSMEIHGLNLLQSMLGPVREVDATGGVSAPGRSASTVVAMLRFESGAAGVVMGGTDGPIGSDIMGLEIQGELGRVIARDGIRSFELNVRDDPLDRIWRPFLFDTQENDFQKATDWHIAEFVQAMRDGTPPPIPAEEGYEALRLAFAVIEAATTDRRVRVDDVAPPLDPPPTYPAPIRRRRPSAGIGLAGYADETQGP
jgi:predicted dehydrogenase